MKITYDKNSENAIYIYLNLKEIVADTVLINTNKDLPMISIDFSKNKKIIGVEIVFGEKNESFIRSKGGKIVFNDLLNEFEIFFSKEYNLNFEKIIEKVYSGKIEIGFGNDGEIFYIKFINASEILDLKKINFNIDWVDY